MSTEVFIKSLTEYIDHITSLEPVKEESSLEPCELVYRGLSNRSYELIPSIDRSPSEHWFNTSLYTEHDLISGAFQKNPNFFSPNELPISRLAKLQHFGIPTRMMDVTTNALVALYFACKGTHNPQSHDGEVIVFSCRPLPALNPYINIIADTYRLISNMNTSVEFYYHRAMKQDYTILLQRPEREQNHPKAIEDFAGKLARPLFVESIESSVRQKNQQGKFIIFPNVISGESVDDMMVFNSLVHMEKDDKSIIQRYIILKENKKAILHKLSLLGINEEYLFADNVDLVFQSVKRRQEERFQ